MIRLSLLCCLLLASLTFCLTAMGCVKDDPVDVTVLALVQEDLTKNYDPAIMTTVIKWEIFNVNLKMHLVPEFPQDKLKELAETAAKSYGTIGRTNGKILTGYVVQIYQKQKNVTTGEEKVYNIAEATFNNGKETVDVKLFGQGDGKYDY